jgi:hypothetical protein
MPRREVGGGFGVMLFWVVVYLFLHRFEKKKPSKPCYVPLNMHRGTDLITAATVDLRNMHRSPEFAVQVKWPSPRFSHCCEGVTPARIFARAILKRFGADNVASIKYKHVKAGTNKSAWIVCIRFGLADNLRTFAGVNDAVMKLLHDVPHAHAFSSHAYVQLWQL